VPYHGVRLASQRARQKLARVSRVELEQKLDGEHPHIPGRVREAATDERLAGRAGKITLISSPSPGQNPTAILGGAAIELPVPEPAGIEQWRLHTLQLHPDGTVEWIVDGRRHASLRSDQPVPDSVHVGIGGRMVGTTIEHGPLRVWGGLRYVPEEDAPSTVGLDRE